MLSKDWVWNKMLLESAIKKLCSRANSAADCSCKQHKSRWLVVLAQLAVLLIMNMAIQVVISSFHFAPNLLQSLFALLLFCDVK